MLNKNSRLGEIVSLVKEYGTNVRVTPSGEIKTNLNSTMTTRALLEDNKH